MAAKRHYKRNAFCATVNSPREPFAIRLRPNVPSKPRFRTPSAQLRRSSLPLIVAPSDMVETAFPCLLPRAGSCARTRRRPCPSAGLVPGLLQIPGAEPFARPGIAPASPMGGPSAGPPARCPVCNSWHPHGDTTLPRGTRHAGPGQQPIRRARAGQCREKVAIIE
jgi:hypothetical protein